ncbi:MAG: UPF0182 family protein, partial [Acidobacteria bacterium]|nr:UPF0182 family protein [Acidobacteriota bacterium]
MPIYELPGKRRSPALRITLLFLILLVLISARSIASYVIEIEWWRELGQLGTFFSMLYYSIAPTGAATLLAFAVLWLAHARALKFAGTRIGEHKIYARISTLALLFVGWILAAGSIDTWTVVRFAGSRGLPEAASQWHDAIFARPLSFYLFDLPFYQMIRGYAGGVAIAAILVYWLAARGWQLRFRLPEMRTMQEIDPHIFRLEGGLESRFL